MNLTNKVVREVKRLFHQGHRLLVTKPVFFWGQRQLNRCDPTSLTFAVISRLTVIELPYVRCFIDYYLNLGVNTLYLLCTRPSEFEEISIYLKDYISQDRVQLYRVVGKVHVNESQNQLLPKVKEDFVINVDIDEFFVIKPFNRLHDFVKANSMAPFYFIWWKVISNDEAKAPTAPYKVQNEGRMGKYMVYKPIIKKLEVHWPIFIFHIIRYKYKKYNYGHGYLLHFMGRTFNDTLLKIVHHNIVGSMLGSTSKTELLILLEKSDLPLRLKYIAWLACATKHQTLNRINQELMQVDYKLEQSILERYLTYEEISRIYAAYQRIKLKLTEIGLPLQLKYKRQICNYLLQLKL